MLREDRLQIRATLDQVEGACQFVADIASEAGMGSDAVHGIYLAVEEICTNVIEHGYRHEGYDKVIDVACRQYYDRISVTVSDDAFPFNPLELDDPDPSAPLLERNKGGWGIFFVKKYTDYISYEHTSGRNHLTIEKHIER